MAIHFHVDQTDGKARHGRLSARLIHKVFFEQSKALKDAVDALPLVAAVNGRLLSSVTFSAVAGDAIVGVAADG